MVFVRTKLASDTRGQMTDKQAIDLRFWMYFAVVLIVATASRLALIDRLPIYDELYQIAPAFSWQDERTFRVLDGAYERASSFSRLIAFSFDLFGERSMTAARLLPSAIPGILLIMVMFFWTHRVAGLAVALTTSALLIFWPNGIEVSQYTRFYSLHGLAFVLAVICFYSLMVDHHRLLVKSLLAGFGLVLIWVAFDLQVLTAIGFGALLVWGGLFFLPNAIRVRPMLKVWLGGLLVVVLAALFQGIFQDKIDWAWETYNWEPWPAQNDTTFYHRHFRDNYPVLWPLFPVAVIVGFRTNFYVTSLCATLFITVFIAQSFGGLKNIRYLYPVMPFFFCVWAITLVAVVPTIFAFLRSTILGVYPKWLSDKLKSTFVNATLGICVCFIILANAAFMRSGNLILGKDDNTLLGKIRWDWSDAVTPMGPWLDKDALIVTTEEMRVVQGLGDYDLGYNKPRFSELIYTYGGSVPPFSIDFRTGRPLIEEPEHLLQVINCHPVGVLLSIRSGIGNSDTISLMDQVRSMGIEVSRERYEGLSIFGWEHPASFETSADCSKGHDFASPTAAARIKSGQSVPFKLRAASADR